MQQLVVEKVWEREFDLRSRRRMAMFCICGMYLVAAVTSMLATLILGQDPYYSFGQQISAAILISACAFAANWRTVEFWAAHVLVASMFLLFFSAAYSRTGISTPITILLPLVPSVAAILLGVKASCVYLGGVFVALLVLAFFGEGAATKNTDGSDGARAMMLAFGGILVTTITMYIVSLNEKLVRAVKSKGGYDEVTNLPNRYFIRDWINQLLLSPEMSNKPLAVLCIGIDHFGEINEKRGNQRGDELMSHAAYALQKAINKEGSVIGRNRGNSFVAAVSTATAEQAEALAKKAQDAVDALKISGVASQYMSVSVGIVFAPELAVLQEREKPAFALIELAVAELYKAQTRGRVQISFSEYDAQGEDGNQRAEKP